MVPREGARRRWKPWQFAAAVAAALAVPVVAVAATAVATWPSGGADISNSHSNAAEKSIGRDNVGQLGVKWTSPTHGDVSAVPAVAGGAVYFPDWGGYLNKIDAATGATIWSR